MPFYHTPTTLSYLLDLLGDEFDRSIAINDYRRYQYRSFTYAELHQWMRRAARWLLKRGVHKGDRILVQAGNSPEWVILMGGSAFIGAVLVPVDRTASRPFFERVMSLTSPKEIFSDKAYPNSLPLENLLQMISSEGEIEEDQHHTLVQGQDVFQMIYTSGTTDAPKGVPLTHANLMANIEAITGRLKYENGWRFLSILPLSHLFEQQLGCIGVLMFCGQITFVRDASFSRVLEVMVQEKASHVVVVPAIVQNIEKKVLNSLGKRKSSFDKTLKFLSYFPFSIRRILSYPLRKRIIPSLQTWIVGGAPLSPETEKFWEALGIRVVQGYGLTEASPIVSCNSFETRIPTSVGHPIPKQFLRIGDGGEILIGGDNVMRGYTHGSPFDPKFFEEGWYKTGDLGWIDEKGALHISGRKKEMILSGSGMNVFPTDIEATLNREAGVKESVVFEDPKREGRLIGAVVSDGVSLPLMEMRERVNLQLGDHQKLSELVLWEKGPLIRTHSHKLKRKEIVEAYVSESSQEKVAPIEAHPLLSLLEEISGPLPAEPERARLKEDLGLDSLAQIRLILGIEDRFNLTVDPEFFQGSPTVKDLLAFLETEKSAKKGHQLSKWPWMRPMTTLRKGIFFLAEHFYFRQLVNVKVTSPFKGRVDPFRPLLFAGNHTSHLDAPLILSTLPSSIKGSLAIGAATDHFFENKSYLRKIFQNLLLPLFPFNRSSKQIENFACLSYLIRHRHPILLFPEGTRSRTGKIQPFKPGIGMIVKEFNFEVVPVGIKGAFDLWPPGQKRPTSGNVEIVYGDSLLFDSTFSEEKIVQTIEQAITRLSEQ